MSTPSSAARPAQPAVAVRPAVVARAVLAGAALAIYALVVVGAGVYHQDFDAYLGAGRDLISGKALYADFLRHPFPDPTLRPAYIYPPAFAVLVTPLAILPTWLAGTVWLIVNQVALAGSLWIVIRWLRPAGWATAALIGATATFYPLWVDVAQGQANLIVLLLVTAGMVGVLRGDARFAAAIGIAAALKLTPGLLLLWLLVERRFRAAAWVLIGFTAISALGAVMRFSDTVTFATRVIPGLAGGTAFYANQSIAGLVARVATSNPYTKPWISLPAEAALVSGVILVALFIYWLVATRARTAQSQPSVDVRGADINHPGSIGAGIDRAGLIRSAGINRPGLIRAAAFLPFVPLASSVTWGHHLVILLPVIWFAFVALEERGWPVPSTVALCALLVVLSIVSRIPLGPAFGQPEFRSAQTMDPVVFLLANSQLFATLALFFSLPWLLRSR